MALSGYGEDHDDHDALDAARRAARRAGMSLGDWLDAVVAGRVPDEKQPPRPTVDQPKSPEESIAAIRARLDAFSRRHGKVEVDESERRMSGDVMRRLEEKLQALSRGKREEPTDIYPPSRHADGTQAPVFGLAHPEERDPAATASAAAIKEALSEIAARQRALEHEFDHAMAGHSDRIDHRIEKIAERLERHIDDASPQAAMRRLEEELRAGLVRFQHDQSATTPELNRQLSELVQRLDDLPPRIADELAGRLDDTARRLDTATRAEVDSIRAEMREIAQEIDRANRAGFEEVVARLTELSTRLDEQPAVEHRPVEAAVDEQWRNELAAIRDEIRLVSGRLEGAQHNDESVLLEEIRRLAGRVEATGPDRLQELERQLDRLVARIGDEPNGPSGEELSAIERRIAGLAERIEAMPASFQDLQRQLEAIAERVGNSPTESARSELVEIERQITSLAEHFEARPGWVRQLERQLEEIGGRASEPPDRADQAELVEIERQIARLAEQLERESAHDLSGLERQISELIRHVEATGQARGGDTALEQELAALKTNVDRANQDNLSTLGALHDTLNRIVDRLGHIEQDVEAGIGPRQLGAATGSQKESRLTDEKPLGEAEEQQLSPDDIIGRIEAVTRSFKDEADDHTPLAPGSGRPEAIPEAAAVGVETDALAGNSKPVRTSREDFIAAARRAAQAAAAESAMPGPSRETPAGSTNVISRLRAYRRPLIFAGTVAVVLIAALLLADRMTALVVSDGEPVDVEPVAAVESEAETAESMEPHQGAAPAPRIVGASQPRAAMVTTGSTGEVAREEIPSFQPTAKAAPEFDTDDVTQERETARSASDIEMPPEGIGSRRLREAAAGGDPVAQFEVATRYSDGKGVAQDLGKAAYWFRLAAAQGLAPAQYRLGSLYEKGNGAPRDIAMARSWYQRAADQGNRAAMHNLAVLYAEGGEGEPDYDKAALWFRQSSEYGLKDSQYNLAILHARGLGVEQSLLESYRWFAAAADQGDPEAAVQRDEIARRLDPDALAEAKLALQSWQAKPLIEEANRVAAPQDGWDDPPPAALDPDTMVREAQSLLNELGYSPGPIDGNPGPMTRRAVIEYQRAEGLPETGAVTRELLDRLTAAAG